MQRLLKGFAQLQTHRGCRTTALGSAFAQALQFPSRAAPHPPPPRAHSSADVDRSGPCFIGGEGHLLDGHGQFGHGPPQAVFTAPVASTDELPDLAGFWQSLPPSHSPTPRALESPTAVPDVPADAPEISLDMLGHNCERSTPNLGKGRGIVPVPQQPGAVLVHDVTRPRYDKNQAQRRIWVISRHSMAYMTADSIIHIEALYVPHPHRPPS